MITDRRAILGASGMRVVSSSSRWFLKFLTH